MELVLLEWWRLGVEIALKSSLTDPDGVANAEGRKLASAKNPVHSRIGNREKPSRLAAAE